MVDAAAAITPRTALPLDNSQSVAKPQSDAMNARLRAKAEEFEAVFLNVMLASAFKGLGENDPFSGEATETWRGLQVEQFAKSISESGGIGVANQIYDELLRMQENANQ